GLNVPILQWRSRQLAVDKITDLEHRALVERVTIFAEGLEEFKGRIVQSVTPPPPAARLEPKGKQNNLCFVFVNAEEADFPLADQRCLRGTARGEGRPAGFPLAEYAFHQLPYRPERRGTPAFPRYPADGEHLMSIPTASYMAMRPYPGLRPFYREEADIFFG